jgi:hypothetical protein
LARFISKQHSVRLGLARYVFSYSTESLHFHFETYSDRVEFSFDNDNDGSGPITENGDDYLYGFGNALEDSFYSLILVDDDDAGGTNDGSSLASHGVGYNHFELGHPLDSADDAHDFSLHFGDIVGFNMVYYYGGEASGAYTTGYFTGSIEIISPPPTCTISVEPETTVVTVGDEFEVKVWIRSVEEGMDWFRFIVAWDTTQLELVEKQVPTVSGWGNGASEYVGQNPLIHFLDVSGGTTVSPIYSDEFWLTIKFKCLASGEAQITLPLEITSSDFTAYERDVWHDHTTDVMFDVTASNGVAKQRAPTTPSNPGGYVGGDVFAANKISVLAPYLIGIISVVAVAAVVIKRRRD